MSKDFEFPEGVQGWLTYTEGQVLYTLAATRNVLELGSWKGRSSICLAQAADHLTCVDHFSGDPGIRDSKPENADQIYNEFRANLRKYGVSEKVTVIREDMKTVRLPEKKFGLVFVDGAHDAESIRRDLTIAAHCVEPEGIIILHDWNRKVIQDAAAEVLGWSDRVLDEVHVSSEFGTYGRRYNPGPKPKVFIGIPHRNGLAGGVASGLIDSLNYRSYEIASFRFHSTSLLTLCFNSLWCTALNSRKKLGLTHFCMHHDDICPEEGWLAKMFVEMKRTNADIISCVVPIKDYRGITSTAVMHKDTKVMRRLTVSECLKLPRSFTAADIGLPDHHLLVNSGLWLCDFTKPWVEDVCFMIRDKIVRKKLENGDTEFAAMCFSEDWVFSKWANEKGLKVVATNAVKLKHQGMVEFPNDEDWGQWKTDQGKDELFNPPEQADDFPQPHVEPRWDTTLKHESTRLKVYHEQHQH